MRINSSVFNLERANTTITFISKDGSVKKTTFAENEALQKKAKSATKGKKKTTKKTPSLIEIDAEIAKKIVKGLKVIKSLCAYYDHGYKQWGCICKSEIIDNRIITPSFVHLRVLCRDMVKQMEVIERDKKSKDLYQHIEKLSYIVDDIAEAMNALTNAINKSKVCDTFKYHEMINGQGKRLGLATLMIRAMLATNSIQQDIKHLTKISVEGGDITTYNLEGSFNRF